MRISKSTKTGVRAAKSCNSESKATMENFYRKELVRMGCSKEDVDNMGLSELKKAYHSNDCAKTGSCAKVESCNASTSTDMALQHIKAAIDILGKSGNKDEVTKDSIANLGVVWFDLNSKK